MDQLITDKKTTIMALIASALAYAHEVGAQIPRTRDEWAAAAFAGAILAWGYVSRDKP